MRLVGETGQGSDASLEVDDDESLVANKALPSKDLHVDEVSSADVPDVGPEKRGPGRASLRRRLDPVLCHNAMDSGLSDDEAEIAKLALDLSARGVGVFALGGSIVLLGNKLPMPAKKGAWRDQRGESVEQSIWEGLSLDGEAASLGVCEPQSTRG